MFSKFLSVVLLVSAVSCGHHIVQSVLPIASIPLRSGSVLIPNRIPASLGTALPATNFEVPKTIPQYLFSLRVGNLALPNPNPIPLQLLAFTGPQTIVTPLVSQTVVSQPLPVVSRTPLLSPAQRILTQPIPVLAEKPIESVERTSVLSNSQLDSNKTNHGFSTPTKPIIFAPNLPELNKPTNADNFEVSTNQTLPVLPEAGQQKLDLPTEPQTEQKIEPFSQNLEQPLSQPLAPQTESVAQPLSEQRIESTEPKMGGHKPILSSYSF